MCPENIFQRKISKASIDFLMNPIFNLTSKDIFRYTLSIVGLIIKLIWMCPVYGWKAGFPQVRQENKEFFRFSDAWNKRLPHMFTGTRTDLLDAVMRWRMRGTKQKKLEPSHYEQNNGSREIIVQTCFRQTVTMDALDVSILKNNTLQAWYKMNMEMYLKVFSWKACKFF